MYIHSTYMKYIINMSLYKVALNTSTGTTGTALAPFSLLDLFPVNS
jgi:hypothetical protein